MAFLAKYLELLGRYAPVDESADIFGLKGIRLGGQLFDETNIGTKAGILAVQAALTSLTITFNGSSAQNILDLDAIRLEIAALYNLSRLIAQDVQTGFMDQPDEEEIVATAGQTVFAATFLVWSPNVALPDIEVFRNGIHMTQDLSGGTTRDFRKTGESTIEFVRPMQVDDRITIRSLRSISNAIAWPYFYDFVTSRTGRAVALPARYRVGFDMLSVFRNGILLVASNTIGVPMDQYEETSMTFVTLGSSVESSEFVQFLNAGVSPDYRFVQTGVTGAVLTVPAYTLGTKRLRIWRNGVLMTTLSTGLNGAQVYAETSTTSITLTVSAIASDVFVIEHSFSVPTWRQDISGATGATRTFTAPYVLGSGKLLVFRNGVLMVRSPTTGNPVDRYAEATATTITLTVPATSSEVFTVINA